VKTVRTPAAASERATMSAPLGDPFVSISFLPVASRLDAVVADPRPERKLLGDGEEANQI
jgi:hypothetical protein